MSCQLPMLSAAGEMGALVFKGKYGQGTSDYHASNSICLLAGSRGRGIRFA